MDDNTTASPGPVVHLWGLDVEDLPPPDAAANELAKFLTSCLQDSMPFIDTVSNSAPDNDISQEEKPWKFKGSKTFPNSEANVEVYDRVLPAAELSALMTQCRTAPQGSFAKYTSETWACRRSVHKDDARPGTASWPEFVRHFRDEHRTSEEAFTPTVTATRTARSWDCSGVGATEVSGRTWDRFSLELNEARHKIGSPLKDRVFGVLLATAVVEGGEEFVVVSMPVRAFESSDMADIAGHDGVVMGAYASVERIKRTAVGSDGSDKRIEWVMATASDAKGNLPMWVQTKAVLGIVAKDVELFLAWIAKDRKTEESS